MNSMQYSPPVSTLRTLGNAHNIQNWDEYVELGLSEDHISELITMVQDDALHLAEPTSTDVWAPIHAWRTLGQLRAVEAIPALLDQLYRIDTYGHDWVNEEFPDVFAMIGPPAIPGVTQYLANAAHGMFARVGGRRIVS